MRVTPARRVARAVVTAVRERSAWTHDVLAQRLERESLTPADTALATRLVYGAVAAEGTLDEALDRYLDRPRKVQPVVRDALRLAAYEILFMRTPPHVAVHQGVELVRSTSPAAAGLANAVLRRLSESAEEFPWGDPDTDLAALARLTGHPLWMAELLVDDLGQRKAEEMMRSGLEPAPLYLAHNPFRGPLDALLNTLAEEGVAPRETGPRGCIEAGSSMSAVRSTALAEGRCIVADAAAQYVASLAGAVPHGRLVDLAAGRGGKTALMQAAALRAGGEASIVAGDIHEFKTELLDRRMAALGVPGVTSVVVDATSEEAIELLGGPASADSVLVDAPCSGLGALRRHPEKRWRLTPADLEKLASIATGLLSTASKLVRPGGFVVYSTCSVSRSENACVAEEFLGGADGSQFEIEDLTGSVPDGWDEFVDAAGWFASHPRQGGPDGHFAAVLRRRT